MASRAVDDDDGSPPPLLNGAGDYIDDDDILDDDFDNELGDDDGDDWDESEDCDVLCLFCEQVLAKMDSFHEHSKKEHKFNLVAFAKKLQLDSISFIKCVNYVRKNKISASELNRFNVDYSQGLPWSADDYMFPFIADDPLLMIDVEDDFEDLEGNTPEGLLDEEMESSISISSYDYTALLKRLRESESRAQTAEARLSAAAEDLSKMKIFAEDFVMNQTGDKDEFKSNSSPRPHNVFHSIRADEDSTYSSSYSHYGIHHEMLSDFPRTTGYRSAISRLDLAGKTVLDLGCGTGILSLFAARAGAKHVYAVDMSDVIYQAMDIARENGLDDKITFLKGRIEDLKLPVTKVDVIVSEWMGYFLLFESMLDSVLYARDVWLAQDGLILPDRCDISLGALGDPKLHSCYVSFWDDVYSFKMSCMKSDVLCDASVMGVSGPMIAGSMTVVKEIDIASCSSSSLDFAQDFTLLMDDKFNSIFGLVGSFDVTFGSHFSCSSPPPLSPDPVVLSTSPHATPTHWKQTVFFFPAELKISPGEAIEGRIDVSKDPKAPRSLVVKIRLEKLNQELVYYLR